MNAITVQFVYHTGVRQQLFSNVRLCGSWDTAGVQSPTWTSTPMEERRGEDGCPTFYASVSFPETQVGVEFGWGVVADGSCGRDMWLIPTEVSQMESMARHRTFTLQSDPQSEHYWLSSSRQLGANARCVDGEPPRIQFAVWAPSAREVSVVFGDPTAGYIYDDGNGIVGEPITMYRSEKGIWETDLHDERLRSFIAFDHRPYMFRVVKDDGRLVYRTDLYSRCQVGSGDCDPARLEAGQAFSGKRQDLSGTVSCSVVVDPEWVTARFRDENWPEIDWIAERDFWEQEFDPQSPIPTRLEDLVIYEMHIGGLGAGKTQSDGTPVPGDLADAIGMLDHLDALGINAVEIMPFSEFEGWLSWEGSASWGYGTSHYFAMEFSGGGRDQFKYFVRECHRRGIAVILDVVYNHFTPHAERAEWAYDSDAPERNIYYWYEGSATDYSGLDDGYVDNQSTGWAPRYHEERVRQMFISSAVAQAMEFHIDGFRVDQTTSIRDYNVLHADGRRVDAANAFGAKFLREFTRTLRLVKPHVFLIAEDHSGWDGVTRPADLGGLGFDAAWYADFYHNLSGDTGRGLASANLLTTAAIGDNRPLAIGTFGNVLGQTDPSKVVYPESHDEAGNSSSNGQHSGRTPSIAVGGAPLVGETRRYGEARTRFSAGMALLSAGTPMFFMGEECGATEPYRYNDFAWHRTDFKAAAAGEGNYLFNFFRALITLRRNVSALRSGSIDIFHADDSNRVLAFSRCYGPEQLIVLASLNDHPFSSGYSISGIRDGKWREVFNSDASFYGGWNDGNFGADVESRSGLTAVLPRAGFVVFRRL